MTSVALLAAAALFESLCAPCHGAEGRGDGVAAHLYSPAPADLRAPLKLGGDAASLRRTLRWGMPATGMPAFGSLEVEALEALVSLVQGWQGSKPARAKGAAEPPPPPKVGRDPLWNRPQARGERAVVPAVAALDAPRCGRCHPGEHEAWQGSRHAKATGPGLMGQYHGATEAFRQSCDDCHAPLVEQRAEPDLHAEGVSCAVCHLRGHQKLGPTKARRVRSPARGLRARPEPRLGRSDFCLRCHNLPLTVAVEGRPLLDTWREWAASPYLVAGVQCQHCHLADGRHDFSGAHDPEAVRKAVRLRVRWGSPIEIDLENLGAGHHFPTTATPRAVLRVRQLGSEGPLKETERSWAVGRTVEVRAGKWHEVADTRVPAGETRTWRYAVERAEGASRLEISLHMFPDYFYARFYRARLGKGGAGEAEYRAALAEAEASGFLVSYQRLPYLPDSSRARTSGR